MDVLEAYATESITVSSSPIGVTAGILKEDGKRPDKMKFVVEDQPIRYTIDGTTVSATIGILVAAAVVVEIEGEANINNFRAIATGTDAVIQPILFSR